MEAQAVIAVVISVAVMFFAAIPVLELFTLLLPSLEVEAWIFNGRQKPKSTGHKPTYQQPPLNSPSRKPGAAA